MHSIGGRLGLLWKQTHPKEALAKAFESVCYWLLFAFWRGLLMSFYQALKPCWMPVVLHWLQGGMTKKHCSCLGRLE